MFNGCRHVRELRSFAVALGRPLLLSSVSDRRTKMKVLSLTKLIAVPLLLALVLSACAPAVPAAPAAGDAPAAESAGEASGAPRVLRIANAEPTQGTDPATAGTSASMRVVELMHDPLWDRDADFKPVPWLAESWEMTEDGKVWTFKLRDGLTFSDGSPITADDVKASFEHLGKSELWSGRTGLIEAIEVVDPLTVQLTMVRPVPELLDLPGATVQFHILSKAAIDAGADWNQPMQVYSGPYMLEEYTPKSRLVLVRNPNYWNKDLAKFDRIEWTFNEDATAGVAAIESGAADVYSPVPAKDVPRLREMPSVTIHEANAASYIGFGFDRSKAPFNDKRVRQAVALIIETDEKTEVCWFGTGSPLYGGFVYDWQTDFFTGFEPYKEISKEDRIAQAKALLDEAGWVEGADGTRVAQGVEGVEDGTAFSVAVPFEANWPASECHTQLLQNWGKGVGLDFQPNRYDPGAFWTDATEGKFQMWHAGIPGAIYAPDSLYQILHSSGTWNPYWFRGSEPELDAMLDEMMAETDLAAKREKLDAINKMVAEEAFIVSNGSQNTLVLTTGEMEGFFPRSDDSSRALIQADIPSR
jgi:peptide/nickel transport system substrate-binding protein